MKKMLFALVLMFSAPALVLAGTTETPKPTPQKIEVKKQKAKKKKVRVKTGEKAKETAPKPIIPTQPSP